MAGNHPILHQRFLIDAISLGIDTPIVEITILKMPELFFVQILALHEVLLANSISYFHELQNKGGKFYSLLLYVTLSQGGCS